MWRVWIEIVCATHLIILLYASPSVWRVWIEIPGGDPYIPKPMVTLRVEGVD